METNKKLRSLLGIGATAAVMMLSGCGSDAGSDAASGGDKPTLGWIVPLPDPWTKPMTKAIELKADELGLDVKTLQANYDTNLQLQSMDSLMQRGVDAIMTFPLDPSAMQPGVDRALDKGIPFLEMFGYDPGKQKDIGFNVISNDEDVARQIGLLAAKKTEGKCKAGIMSGPPGITILELRAKGLRAGLEEGGCKILDEKPNDDGTPEKAADIAKSWQTRFGGDMTVIAGIDDTNAEASVAVRRGDFQPVITGFNGEDAVRPLIKSGEILASAQQPVVRIGAILVAAADKLIKGEDVPANPVILTEPLTADNLDDIPTEKELSSAPLKVTFTKDGDRWIAEASLPE